MNLGGLSPMKTDINLFEVEFYEAGNPKGPEYRWFSSIGHALEFMHGITGETHVAEMTFRNHLLEQSAAGVATFLNHLKAGREQPAEELPF